MLRSLRVAVALVIVLVVLAPPAGRPLAAGDGLNPATQKIVAAVSEARLAEILRKLEGFETRNTMSDPSAPDRGIGAARQWIFDQFRGYGGNLEVSFDTYQVAKKGRVTRDVELRNVVAVLPGRTPHRFYVSGHYDSAARPPGAPSTGGEGSETGRPAASTPSLAGTPFDPAQVNMPAPGVNDDGSGTATVMELARVFAQSGLTFDATIVFIAFAGEEQGLVGSTLHAQKSKNEHLAIDGVLNNDIVGGERGGDGIVNGEVVRVFSEGPEDSMSRALARYVRAQAARYVPSHRVELVARHDRFGRGGDHTPFNREGYAAVRLTEAKENYSRQHTLQDTFEGVSVPYLARNVRVNAAALAGLALAPPAPGVSDDRGRPMLTRQPSGYDAHLRWTSAGGHVAGYKVYWRTAWTPDWQHALAVGPVTQYVMADVSVDDYVFGVAAVDADGNESLIAAYVNPPRAREEYKTLDKMP